MNKDKIHLNDKQNFKLNTLLESVYEAFLSFSVLSPRFHLNINVQLAGTVAVSKAHQCTRYDMFDRKCSAFCA